MKIWGSNTNTGIWLKKTICHLPPLLSCALYTLTPVITSDEFEGLRVGWSFPFLLSFLTVLLNLAISLDLSTFHS